MHWFDIPEDYNCVTRQNDTTLYAYKNNIRDTYTLNGLEWEHTASSNFNNTYNNLICVSGSQVPSQVTPWLIGCGFVLMLCIFNHIIKMIIGVRR